MSLALGSDPRERTPDGAPGSDIRPQVALPREGVPLPVLIGLALVLALALFLFLDAHRRALLEADNGGPSATPINLPPAPPALALPPVPPPAPVATPQSPPAPRPASFARPLPPRPQPMPPPGLVGEEPLMPARPVPQIQHGSEPALVIDLTSGAGASVNASEGGAGAAGEAAGASDETARATLIHNRSAVIPEGAIMSAVLETPLNSDRPGLARAIVSKDARGFDGSRILIPRGSRLIGEFKADASPGLRRILVTWTRLIRPDGVAIRIGSPVADSLGGAGVPGSVNTHFAARFASAVLQSALTIGTNLASTLPTSGTSAIYVGLPAQSAQLGQQLVPNTARPPTIKVKEGAEIAVLVARDLDFSGTPAVR